MWKNKEQKTWPKHSVTKTCKVIHHKYIKSSYINNKFLSLMNDEMQSSWKGNIIKKQKILVRNTKIFT